MDGTLLTHHGISEENLKAIRYAQSKNIPFAIATGRHYIEAIGYLKQAKLNVPLLSLNGAAIYDENLKLIKSFPIEKNDYQSILNHPFITENILIEISTVKHILSSNEQLRTKIIEKFILEHEPQIDEQSTKARVAQHMAHLPALFVPSFEQYFAENPEDAVLKILLTVTDSKYLPQLQRLKDALSTIDTIEVTSSHPLNLEITVPNATKGYAVTELAQHLHIDLSTVMVLGDNLNDLSMITLVGYGIAMGNALDAVKLSARYTTSTNIEHGVAKAIYHFIPEEVPHV